jgi:hypothetical protein
MANCWQAKACVFSHYVTVLWLLFPCGLSVPPSTIPLHLSLHLSIHTQCSKIYIHIPHSPWKVLVSVWPRVWLMEYLPEPLAGWYPLLCPPVPWLLCFHPLIRCLLGSGPPSWRSSYQLFPGQPSTPNHVSHTTQMALEPCWVAIHLQGGGATLEEGETPSFYFHA